MLSLDSTFQAGRAQTHTATDFGGMKRRIALRQTDQYASPPNRIYGQRPGATIRWRSIPSHAKDEYLPGRFLDNRRELRARASQLKRGGPCVAGRLQKLLSR